MKVYPSSKMSAGQTNWPYVINLGNSIIGVSVLTMPFCFKTCGVLLGALLLLCSAWVTSISCNLLVKAAYTSRRRSYQYLAFHAIGQAGKLFVEICMIGLLIGTCIAFYVIMGDLGPAIISKVLGIENTDSLRTGLLVVMALGIALPLALLKNLESLSNINAISLGFYAVFVAEVFTAAFPNLWSGLWVTKVTYWNPEGIFKCLPIFSLAFSCQTQLFVMYDALPEPSLQRMHYITKSAIGMCVAVYLCVGYFGYVAFCDDDIQGDILMNFRPTIFSEAIKFGFVLSIAVSFPLVIFPCRASIYTMFFAKDHTSHDNISGSLVIPPYHFNVITLGIILGTMTVGILVPNIEFVLAMTGATMGSMVCLIVPAIVFIRIMSMSKANSNAAAQFILFLGVTVLLASSYITLNAQVSQTKDIKSVIKIVRPEDDIKPVDNIPVKDAIVGNDAIIEAPGDKAGKDIAGVMPNEKSHLKEGELEHLVEDKAQNQESDKRQEPPNPLAPVEQKDGLVMDSESKLKIDDDGDTEKKEKREVNEEKDEIKDTPVKGKDKTIIKQDEKLNEKIADDDKEKDDKVGHDPNVNEKEAALKDEDADEAKNILKELKEQQQAQKLLIEEQKQIIEDLKQHQKDVHQVEHVDGQDVRVAAAQQPPLLQQLPVQQEQQQPVQEQPLVIQQEPVPAQQQAVQPQQQAVQPQQQAVQPQQQAVQLQQAVQPQQQALPQQKALPQQQAVPQQQEVPLPQQNLQGVQQQNQEIPQQQVKQTQQVVQQAIPQQQVPNLNVEPQQILQNIDLNVRAQQPVEQQQVLAVHNAPEDIHPQVPELQVESKKADNPAPIDDVKVNIPQQEAHEIGQFQGQDAALKQNINKQLVDIGGGIGDKFIAAPDETVNKMKHIHNNIVVQQPLVVRARQDNTGHQLGNGDKAIVKEGQLHQVNQEKQQQPEQKALPPGGLKHGNAAEEKALKESRARVDKEDDRNVNKRHQNKDHG